MIFSKRVFLQALAVLGLGAARITPARADAQTEAALGVVDAWYLPKTEALLSAFSAQRSAWESCAPGANTEPLKSAFQAAWDAWAQMEHAGFGPMGVHERADRIAFFPDRRNAVQKAVLELLARAEKTPLTSDDVAKISVAGQGLPALERLLYDAPLAKTFDGNPARQTARCTVGLAVAGNLVSIAETVKAEWLAPDGPRAKLAAGQGSPPAFADGRQALSREITDLATGLQRLADLKLRRFLGTSTENANPLLAEGVRSGRVKRNLAMAAQGIADEAKALAATAPEVVRTRVGHIADRFAQRYAAMPDNIAELAGDPATRGEIVDFIAPIRAMQTVMAAELGPALGVQLGFNSLDGD